MKVPKALKIVGKHEGKDGLQARNEMLSKMKRNKKKETNPVKEKENKVRGEAGSVLAEKFFEPLDAMLKAYEARLKPLETMEERWKNYPDPAQESRQLEIYKKLVEVAQAIEEQNKTKQLPETQTQKQNETTHGDKLAVIVEEEKENGYTEEKVKESEPILIPNTSVPEVNEEWANQLWEAVKHTQPGAHSLAEPPIDEIDFDQKTLELELRSEYGDAGSEKSEDSKAETLKTLPSYQGDYEAKSDIRKLPSVQNKPAAVLDLVNLSALMSAPIKVTLPLADVLKVKPELWKDVGKMLRRLGVKLPNSDTISAWQAEEETKKNYQPVPINKVGEYCEGDDGNTTIPVEFAGKRTMAILDSGAGIAIATKRIWETWGKPTLRKTRMKLQLADGYVERPIGLLEKVVVTSCGVEYEQTFAVVDFGLNPNYDIILGRPFMRQLKMIQDWGFNYIYLRQEDAITRINLADHSYRDVARTPIEDFESATATRKLNKALTRKL